MKDVTYYIIPSNYSVVEMHNPITSWEKTDHIDPNIPTVIVSNDRPKSFIVVYKGMMQRQGGSGCCYNPTKKTYFGNDPMDNSKMKPSMSKWEPYSPIKVLHMVIRAKWFLLKNVMKVQGLPFYYWEIENYEDLPSILINQLDAVGMGKLDPKELKEINRFHKSRLMLNPA
jgi:hypothetical protein